MLESLPVVITIVVLLLGFLRSAIKIVPEYERGVIFRLGRVMGNLQHPENDLIELIRAAGEAIVVVDPTAQISWANAAFIEMVTPGTGEVLEEMSLKSFFDPAELDIDTIIDSLRTRKRIRVLPSSLHANTGEIIEVELSAVEIPNLLSPRYGFFIRNVSLRVANATPISGTDASVEAILDQLGKVPLKDLVQEEVDDIEKKVIAGALELTGNNRSATAKVLGISRQSLYQKLSRYGLDEG